ncbi:uncharacterized protein LOC114278826 [Camellia sinensis]|uniref:uncharacterized protein LOC114278826 n=1 Tax=Camellia sinensis TaxID=4442 RepID=UPI001036D97A|nr:uncharacterized protein LOC114278826 [Camellia sinensis]
MERIWLQKSRLNWNLKGDKITKFFHIIATNRQNTNAIDSMSVNGELVMEPLEVKQAVYDHFNLIFSEQWTYRPKLLGPFKVITQSQHFRSLDVEFSKHGIWAAMADCDNAAQSVFLGGRNILDGVLIANEVVDWWKKSRRKGLILKLDFQKAYDTVNWNYLLQMLSNFGFGDKWVKRIHTCISSARISVLVNGSPTPELCPQKGLKQAEWSEVLTIKRILRCFEIISGLKINFQKNGVRGVGLSEECVKIFASRLNCTYHKLPLKYLGLPLGTNPSRRVTWKPVVDNFKKKLSGWKRRLLSFTGRVTLIKSVLSSLPIYYMSLFRLPRGVAKELDKIQAAFLWGDSDVRRKVHLVKWKELTMDKKQGGLGIRNLSSLNNRLLAKWWWRFGKEDSSLWKQVICSKYKLEGGRWFPFYVEATNISRVWSDIIFVGDSNSSLLNYFIGNGDVEIKIGYGERISFWVDNWMGTMCLKSQFPRLYSLSEVRGITLKL